MSFLKKFVTALAVGAAVYMTGGLAAGAIGLKTGLTMSTLAMKGAALGGLGFVSAYLGRPKANRQAVNARLNMSVDPNAMGKIVYGETALATDVVYNEQIEETRVFYVVAGAMHEIDSFGKFYIDDEEIEFDANDEATGDWAGALKIYRNLGTRTQDAFNINISEWPSTARGAGIAHYGLLFDARSENGQKKLAGGVPSRITHVAKGAKVYDPRKDSTIGGTGTHRVDDQNTWEFSGNWALVVANYLIGVRLFDSLVYGVGVDPVDIDWQQVADMADVCDTEIDGKPKYHIAGVLDITNDHEQTIALLESSIDGKVSKVGGKYYIWCPHDDTANVKLTITDDDIVSEQGLSYSPTDGLSTLYNTARGQYVSPSELYQLKAYPQVKEDTAIAEDGKQRILTYDLTMIQEESVAQRIARERIRRTRFTASISMLMGPRYIALKPFDIVEVNIKETNNQPELFRVVSITGSVNGFAQVELIEEDPSIYDTTAALGPSLTQLSPNAYNPTQVVTPVNVQATNVVVQGVGSVKDAIRLTWNDPGAFVRETEVRFRINDTATDYEHSIANFSSSIVISPVEPATEYDLQVRHVTREGVLSDWIQVIHTSGDETLNVIREGQIDDFIPDTEFGIRVRSELEAADNLVGGIDELLERVAQDINDELAVVEANAEIRKVRIENTQQIIALVNEYLEELQGETLPELNARLVIAEDELENLQVTVIPNINNRLDTAENDLTVLNGSTIPQLQDDLDIAEGTIAAIQGEIFSVTGSVPLTIDDVLETVCQDVAEIYQEIYADRIGANSVTALSIKAGSILADKIAANAITADKIAANAVTADKIVANAISADKLAANSVSADKIVSNSITAQEIAAFTITGEQIQAASVNADRLVALSITTNEIAANAVNADKIAANSIGADKIIANSITGDKIQANTITGDLIQGNTITGDLIDANTITGDKISGETITGDKIQGNTITALQIASETITGEQIVGRSIAAGKLVAGTITAAEIDALAITSEKIAAGAITAEKIEAGAVNAAKLTADAIDGKTITGATINGGQLNLASSGKSIALRTDEDFVLWFGDTSIAPNNRSKSNGDFWIAADGSYRSNIRRRSSVGGSELQSTNYTQRSISLPSVKGTADVTATLTGLLGFDVSSTTVSNLSIQIELRRGTTVLVTETIPIPTTGTGFNQSFQLAGTFFNATISDNNTGKNYNDTTAYNIRARLQGNGLSNSTTASVRMEIIGLEISDV